MSDKDTPEGVEVLKVFGRLRAIIKKEAATGEGDPSPFDVKVPLAKRPPAKKKPDGKNPFDVSVPVKEEPK